MTKFRMDTPQHDTAQLRAQARDGAPEAQFQLTALHRKGARGLKRDPERAAAFYMKAALQNHVEAQFQVAVALKRGCGVVANSAEAAKWFAIAAGQGHAKAQYQMGEACAKGAGVPKDARESARWHHRAAEQGHHWSMYKLGEMHQEGVDVARSAGEARKWYERAAERGNPKAPEALSRLEVRREHRHGVAGRRMMPAPPSRIRAGGLARRGQDDLLHSCWPVRALSIPAPNYVCRSGVAVH